MVTRRRSTEFRMAAALLAVLVGITSAALSGRLLSKKLTIQNAETGEMYVSEKVRTGDRLEFGWTHSFEHIPWNEYYEILEDGSFVLHTISVAGFGAGIPQFNWINSRTALREIRLNGELLIRGEDMPHHEKMVLVVK